MPVEVPSSELGPGRVVLVEGASDKAALEAAAAVLQLDLSDVAILVMSGATNIGHFLGAAVARGLRVAGLYDTGERAHIVRALAEAGLTQGRRPEALPDRGFFVCDPDLEAELIAALGTDRVTTVIERQADDLRRFRKLQQMPAWRGRPVEDQLRRWFGSGGSRKVHYASLLVQAMAPEDVPHPLAAVLEYALRSRR